MPSTSAARATQPSAGAPTHAAARRWFRDARFGLFIHWGLYAIPARSEWVMFTERIPPAEYARLAERFTPPVDFHPREWVRLARAAGARYVVLTTRHHDGFCLFDSQVGDFTSVKTAARRDFVAEFVAACRAEGMPIGLYYSLMDWRFPACAEGPVRNPENFAAMVDQVHGQVRELLTNYGKIDILWYDGNVTGGTDVASAAVNWRARELHAMARKLQPHLLINDRAGLPEDFDTP